MKNKIEYEYQVSKTTMQKIFAEGGKYSAELAGLYMYLCMTADKQQTHIPKATNSFLAKGLSWGMEKIKARRKGLVDMGLIETIQRKKSNGDFGNYYTKINYLKKISLSEISTSSDSGLVENLDSVENNPSEICDGMKTIPLRQTGLAVVGKPDHKCFINKINAYKEKEKKEKNSGDPKEIQGNERIKGQSPVIKSSSELNSPNNSLNNLNSPLNSLNNSHSSEFASATAATAAGGGWVAVDMGKQAKPLRGNLNQSVISDKEALEFYKDTFGELGLTAYEIDREYINQYANPDWNKVIDFIEKHKPHNRRAYIAYLYYAKLHKQKRGGYPPKPDKLELTKSNFTELKMTNINDIVDCFFDSGFYRTDLIGLSEFGDNWIVNADALELDKPKQDQQYNDDDKYGIDVIERARKLLRGNISIDNRDLLKQTLEGFSKGDMLLDELEDVIEEIEEELNDMAV